MKYNCESLSDCQSVHCLIQIFLYLFLSQGLTDKDEAFLAVAVINSNDVSDKEVLVTNGTKEVRTYTYYLANGLQFNHKIVQSPKVKYS